VHYRYGKGTALITGADKPTGFEYAKEMMRQGFDICLLGDKLTEISATLRADHNPKDVKVETIEANSERPHLPNYRELVDQIDKIEDLTLIILAASIDSKGSFDC
jgi:short-subunit dehydrogenase